MDLEQNIKRMYDYFTEINKTISLLQWHYKDKFRQSTETNQWCVQGNGTQPIGSSQTQVMESPITEQTPATEQNQAGSETNGTREFTIEELQQYDGTNGKPAYIAVDGVVYDVSNEARWAGGRHFGVKAGTDGSTNYMQCHGKSGAVNKLKKVGVVKK